MSTHTYLSKQLVRRVGSIGVNLSSIAHWCPGCADMHDFAVFEPLHNGARWSWNSDLAFPTFTPSMLIRIGPYTCDNTQRIDICHYFLSKGVLEYLTDTTHNLRGQRKPLPDIPQEALRYSQEVR